MTPGQVESARKLLVAGMPPQVVARNLGVSVPTLYRGLPARGAGKRNAVTQKKLHSRRHLQLRQVPLPVD